MTENLPPPSREHPQPEYARITESKFWGSFHYAFSGIMYATRTQPNMRIHLVIAAAVLIVAMLLHLERIYIVALIVTIVIVLSLELFNTAIEAVVDLLTVAHHPLAKTAKDAAAGAVFIASVGAVLVGVMVIVWVDRWRKRSGIDANVPADELGHYRSLFERGLLTSEEYERIRRRLEFSRPRSEAASVPDAPAANSAPAVQNAPQSENQPGNQAGGP